MTAIDDLTTFAQSLRRSMWRQSGRFHRTRLTRHREVHQDNQQEEPTMSKYIDLEDTLLQSCHKAHDYPFVMDVKMVLAWLRQPHRPGARTNNHGG